MTKDKDTSAGEKVMNDLLSAEEKTKIEKDVLAELEADNKKKAAAAYKASLISKAKKDAVETPKEGDSLLAVFVDLPPNSDKITLDGKQFIHGRTYHVTKEVADTLNEVMHRGYEHEDEVKGRKDSNSNRRKQNARL